MFKDILDLIKTSTFNRIIASVLLVIICIIVYKVFSRLIRSRYDRLRDDTGADARALTYLKVSISILRVAIVLFAFFSVLEIFSININSLLTGVGITAVVGGLIIQDLMKDAVRGTTILSDHYFKLGDVVIYGDVVGEIIQIGMTSTKLRSIADQSVISVANRKIEEIRVLTPVQLIEIPLPYDISRSTSVRVMNRITEEVGKLELVTGCEYAGTNSLADSSIKHLLKVSSNPADRDQAKRNVLGRALEILEEEGIAVPFAQIDVHSK